MPGARSPRLQGPMPECFLPFGQIQNLASMIDLLLNRDPREPADQGGGRMQRLAVKGRRVATTAPVHRDQNEDQDVPVRRIDLHAPGRRVERGGDGCDRAWPNVRRLLAPTQELLEQPLTIAEEFAVGTCGSRVPIRCWQRWRLRQRRPAHAPVGDSPGAAPTEPWARCLASPRFLPHSPSLWVDC